MRIERYLSIRKKLKELIKGTPFEGKVLFVGGCCRDELMGMEIKDIDMAVNLPLGGIRLAEWLQENRHTSRKIVTYPTYQTAMFHLKYFPDVELEAVQTRKEKYTDTQSRNPITAFGSIEDDCMRRDLTINSLYYNISTDEVVDITGHGVDDIHDHIIRTPNDPDITYDDDPLRILRCIRFASRFGWEIEKTTYEGMVRNADRLAIITHERIKDELDKMLTCKHTVMAMELIRRIGAMPYVLPELVDTFDMGQNEYHFGTVWEHTMAVMEKLESNQLILRMAALLHDVGKVRVRTEEGDKIHFLNHEQASADMVDDMLRRLKYGNDFIREVQFLVKHHMSCKSWGDDCHDMKPKKLRKLQYACGTEERFRDLMLLIDADNKAHAEDKCMLHQVEEILRQTEVMKAQGSAMFGYKLPFDGKDVMAIKGIKPGVQVKECLDYLLKLAFNNPLMEKEVMKKHLLGYKFQKSKQAYQKKKE